jgi:predicted NAD/FAD-dependent oxidoreductase
VSTTRRDFVAMLLGAPVAAALACRGGARRALPPGELVDTGMARGHAALRAPVPPITLERARPTDVAIVGAGVAGLAAAWALRRAGIRDVRVLELDAVIGGTAKGDDTTLPAPWGAHYVVAPQAHQAELVALLAEMNAIEGWSADGAPIVDEALRCREPEERVLHRGRWYPGLYLAAGASADDLAQLRRFEAEVARWAAWRDAAGRRAFALPIATCSGDPEVTALDRGSFAAWLDERGLTSPRLRWLCDYACRDDYGLDAAGTSAWAGLFYFAARLGADSSDGQPVITWPDGNRPLVRALATGVEVETRVAVVDVTAGPAGATLIAVGDGGPFAVTARRVIVATPRHVARRIVAALRDRPERAIDTAPWVVANLHLRDRPRERPGTPPAWDNVLRDSPSLGYVSATHQAGRDVGPTVWTWYYPFTDLDAAGVRRRLEGAGRDEWAEVALADLSRAHHDLRDHVTRVDVAYWGHGMARPTVGAIWGGDRAARAAPLGPIHFAHTDASGLALFEEALDHGVRAAREVIAALGRPS